MRTDGTFGIPAWDGEDRVDGKWETASGGQALALKWNTFPEDRLLPSFWFAAGKMSITWKDYATVK